MKEFSEAAVLETREMNQAAEAMEYIENPAEAIEQQEMEAFAGRETSDEVNREQQEMDAFTGERLGMKTIYYPDGEEQRARGPRLGEYRIFAQTGKASGRYDIFCDG